MTFLPRNVELTGRDCREVAKSQALRVVDVLALGPFMIAFGLKNPRDKASTFLVVAGVLTILYNLSNFLETRERNA